MSEPRCVNAHHLRQGGAGGPCPWCERPPRRTAAQLAAAWLAAGGAAELVDAMKKADADAKALRQSARIDPASRNMLIGQDADE